jgi:hypothetical protein
LQQKAGKSPSGVIRRGKLLLERIAQFRVTAPCAEWNGVWSLVEK